MEALILAIIIAYAVKKAAEDAHVHWQKSKAANRQSTRGQSAGQRARSAARHDTGYWAHQVLNGFPQIRHGLADGWHAGRTAQAEGAERRRNARTEHLEQRASAAEQVREHRKRQDEALDRIRRARQPEPEPAPVADREDDASPPTRRPDGKPETAADKKFFDLRQSGYKGPIDQDGNIPPPRKSQEGTPPMAGDTTYTQQLHELEEIRRDAEEEVNSVRRKRMQNRLDVLSSLGLDRETLSEAAAIDDALQAQEKAAQQTLDAADTAVDGLRKRHGNIQEAVDSSPVDKPAEPEFYEN